MKRSTHFKLLGVVAAAVVLVWFGVSGSPRGEQASIIGLGQHGPRPELTQERTALRVPGSAVRARALALNQVHAGHLVSFYCGCAFEPSGAIRADSCGIPSRGDQDEASRVSWDLVVPARRFGYMRACWRDGNPACVKPNGERFRHRRCCNQPGVDDEFRHIYSDLQNLVPVVEAVRLARDNRPFGEVEGERRPFGDCDFEPSEELVEPPEQKRGDIARIYLYMSDIYGIGLTPAERQRFLQWHRDDPPCEWERERDRRIEKIQKVGNPHLESRPRPAGG
jgi:deoxyribonuclease-1